MSQQPADLWTSERESPPAPSWRVRWRRMAARTQPDAQSAVFNAQVWIDQAPWRPAALWSVAAGLLAAGLSNRSTPLDWREVLLLLLLADLLWGGLWRLAGGRNALSALPATAGSQSAWLPYVQPGSPAARLLSGDDTDLWAYAVRVGAPTALLALLVAAVLGTPALALTGVALLVAAFGWTMRRTLQRSPILLAALMAIGLPWLLTLLQLQAPVTNEGAWAGFALLVLWTVHHWGELRATADIHDWLGLALMGGSELALCLLLIVAQAPLWLAPIVVLLLPTWLLVQRRSALARMRFLWLAAMLLSAAALGQVG
jgi:hypothetical protein